MQLGIVHYHLNRGGVTQVILNHLRALSAVWAEPARLRVVVLYGGRKEAWQDEAVAALDRLDISLVAVPGLEYDSQPVADPKKLADALTDALKGAGFKGAGSGSDDTVLHIHNHALGKNASLPGATALLARAGYAQVLQIHDFAEDFRPENYRHLVQALASDHPDHVADQLYPQGSAIHYAVLNGRDQRILADAGVAPPRLHCLPNPVSEFGALPDRTAARQKLTKLFDVSRDQQYLLYPVRGIRRKNVGELLLWAAASRDATQYALTLPPLNPAEQTRYAAWKRLAQELSLPVLFEVGAPGAMQFGENLSAADGVLTTSVAEGFGMVFLETWLANLFLLGRDLPEITGDFVASGLEFQQLSAEVNIPIDWVGRSEFSSEMRGCYATVLEAYGRPQPDVERSGQQVSALFADDLLDFARCSARLQAFIVSQVAQDQGRQQELLRLNPHLAYAQVRDSTTINQRTVANAQAVRHNYSLESSGMRLRKLYQTALDSPRCEPHDLPSGASILDAFLSLQRFNPIRIN